MEAVLRTAQTPDWITFLIFASLIFIVSAKGLFYGRYMNFIILPFNNKYIFLYNKKDKLMKLVPGVPYLIPIDQFLPFPIHDRETFLWHS